MPRKRVVSRTLKLTDCKCLMIDLQKEKSMVKTYTILGHLTLDQVNRRGDRIFTTDREKFARCKSVQTRSELYYLTEEEFFKLARKKGDTKK